MPKAQQTFPAWAHAPCLFCMLLHAGRASFYIDDGGGISLKVVSCVPADITLTAYSYERILAENTNADTDRLLPYEDPVPEGVGDLAPLVEELNIQKCIMINTQARLLTHCYGL